MASGYWEPNGYSRLQGGLEGDVDEHFFLRAGYQLSLPDNQFEGLTGLTAGAGLKIGSFALDYAYVPFGDFGASHRVSLGYVFEAAKEIVKVKEIVQVPVTIIQQALPKPVTVIQSAPPVNPGLELHFKFPSDPLAQGKTLEDQGKWTEAIQYYRNSVLQDAHNVEAWMRMGNLYYKAGKKEYAIQCFQSVLSLAPDNTQLRNWLDQYKALRP